MVGIHRRAFMYGMGKYPDAHRSRHESFAASVEELVTSKYLADTGPTIRSHLVSWSLAGPGGTVSVTRTERFKEITVLYPDGTMPCAGTWEYIAAIKHAEPIVYGKLHKDAIRVIEQEGFFDDDPADIQLLIDQVKAELSLCATDRLLDLLRELKSKL